MKRRRDAKRICISYFERERRNGEEGGYKLQYLLLLKEHFNLSI